MTTVAKLREQTRIARESGTYVVITADEAKAVVDELDALIHDNARAIAMNADLATDAEALRTRVKQVERERDEALAECERLRALVEAADHLYAAAEHIGGTPGCWKCEAADEYRHARAAIDAGRKA